jgi:hypothetical protein
MDCSPPSSGIGCARPRLRVGQIGKRRDAGGGVVEREPSALPSRRPGEKAAQRVAERGVEAQAGRNQREWQGAIRNPTGAACAALLLAMLLALLALALAA